MEIYTYVKGKTTTITDHRDGDGDDFHYCTYHTKKPSKNINVQQSLFQTFTFYP